MNEDGIIGPDIIISRKRTSPMKRTKLKNNKSGCQRNK